MADSGSRDDRFIKSRMEFPDVRFGNVESTKSYLIKGMEKTRALVSSKNGDLKHGARKTSGLCWDAMDVIGDMVSLLNDAHPDPTLLLKSQLLAVNANAITTSANRIYKRGKMFIALVHVFRVLMLYFIIFTVVVLPVSVDDELARRKYWALLLKSAPYLFAAQWGLMNDLIFNRHLDANLVKTVAAAEMVARSAAAIAKAITFITPFLQPDDSA